MERPVNGGLRGETPSGLLGIDGISFGPAFGAPKGSKPYLNVAYGIYGDTTRSDNDYQVILNYDPRPGNNTNRRSRNRLRTEAARRLPTINILFARAIPLTASKTSLTTVRPETGTPPYTGAKKANIRTIRSS